MTQDGDGFQVPVVLIIYRRPDLTKRVFETVREVRPRVLYVVADGPRNEEERPFCEEARATTLGVDWPCSVTRLYSEKNLGCDVRPATGLTTVFGEESRAIILEDDCIPDPSFFDFCRELLDRYEDDERVMHICGSRFLPPLENMAESYSFSKYPIAWGWATWRRAWKHYDFSLSRYAREGKRVIARVHDQKWERQYWTEKLNLVLHGRLDAWDYQWVYCCWERDGLAVVPSVNLVTNLGAHPGGTHEWPAGIGAITAQAMGPLRHPGGVAVDEAADRECFRRFFGGGPPPSIMARFPAAIRRRVERFVRRMVRRA